MLEGSVLLLQQTTSTAVSKNPGTQGLVQVDKQHTDLAKLLAHGQVELNVPPRLLQHVVMDVWHQRKFACMRHTPAAPPPDALAAPKLPTRN